ncbi:head decoration protein [Ochrobactrum sp. MR28]|nr:head decoration protein [Ochrobactrum sp. MR28]MBX8818772.1 head decoration protein [Ochrobactrum sp. MR31]
MSEILKQDLRTTAHYIIFEVGGTLARDVVTIASGSGALKAGTVLGQITATKKYVPHKPTATDGSEVACAVLYEGCDAATQDVRRTVTSRSTEVAGEALIWGASVTAEHKTTALAALAQRHIVAR